MCLEVLGKAVEIAIQSFDTVHAMMMEPDDLVHGCGCKQALQEQMDKLTRRLCKLSKALSDNKKEM